MTDYQEVKQTMTLRTNIRVKTTSIKKQESVKVDLSESPRTQYMQYAVSTRIGVTPYNASIHESLCGSHQAEPTTNSTML